mmetsp:Transcript_23387/g.60130  ORF Transcript_23387/g.60130 Transcript_23387/m.60130 type:complete len:229 (-) Transcript_23387:2127-2813(-)
MCMNSCGRISHLAVSSLRPRVGTHLVNKAHAWCTLVPRGPLVPSSNSDACARFAVLAQNALRLHQLPGTRGIFLVLEHVRVRVVVLHGRKGVVDIAVVSLIGVHALERVHPLGVVVEVPVALCDVGRWQLSPSGVQLGARRLDVRDDVVVRLTRGLLQVADEAVHRLWLHHVDRHQEGRHAELCGDTQGARDRAGLEHLEAGEQVHPLVLRLLKQRADPAVVLPQHAQ